MPTTCMLCPNARTLVLTPNRMPQPGPAPLHTLVSLQPTPTPLVLRRLRLTYLLLLLPAAAAAAAGSWQAPSLVQPPRSSCGRISRRSMSSSAKRCWQTSMQCTAGTAVRRSRTATAVLPHCARWMWLLHAFPSADVVRLMHVLLLLSLLPPSSPLRGGLCFCPPAPLPACLSADPAFN